MEMKDEIQAYLISGLCQVTFTKKDGTERTIVGTINPDLIPYEKHPKNDGVDRVKNTDVQPVYDTDLEEWRSFRWDSVISFDAI